MINIRKDMFLAGSVIFVSLCYTEENVALVSLNFHNILSETSLSNPKRSDKDMPVGYSSVKALGQKKAEAV